MKKINIKQVQFLTLSLLMLVTYTTFTAPSHQQAQRIAGATRSPRTNDQEYSEKELQAIELLRKFLTCPTNQLPTWKDFVIQITTLLAGIDEYKALCKSLLEVRDVTNPIWGRKKIADALAPHILSIKKIPADIVKTFTNMPFMQRYNRIKF